MKRRVFLGNTAVTVTAAAAAWLAGCSPNEQKPAHNDSDTKDTSVLDEKCLIG